MELNYLLALISLKNSLPGRVGRDTVLNPPSQIGQNADSAGSLGRRMGQEGYSNSNTAGTLAGSGFSEPVGSVVGRVSSPSPYDLGREMGERGIQIPLPERVGRSSNR